MKIWPRELEKGCQESAETGTKRATKKKTTRFALIIAAHTCIIVDLFMVWKILEYSKPAPRSPTAVVSKNMAMTTDLTRLGELK